MLVEYSFPEMRPGVETQQIVTVNILVYPNLFAKWVNTPH